MKIGIIGIGVVGSAVYKSYQLLCQNLEIVAYDKYTNIGTLEEMLSTSIVFLCLPTLYDQRSEQYDKSAIHQVCGRLKEHHYRGLVVIKSTVEPSTCQDLAEIYGLRILHNPEFLSAATAFEDFHYQKHVVIGYTTNPADTELLSQFFTQYYPDAHLTICTAIESETIKLLCNNFYAAKVQLFNEFYLLCQKNGADYQTVKTAMLRNGWIHPQHTTVPGPDGQLSYGGMCFPKDTQALLSYMKRVDTPHAIIGATVSERNMMRND